MGTQVGTTSIIRLSLGHCSRLAADADGIDLRQLVPGDSVVVRTCHSTYTLRVEDPQQGQVAARGDGSFLTESTSVRMLGATLSGRGTLVKTGWLLIGYKIVLSAPEGEILTSRIRALWVNGAPLVAAAGTH